MRRLSIAALSAAVILSACNDRRETPTEPRAALASAKKDATGSCVDPFPTADLIGKAGTLFNGPLSNATSAKLKSIASQCERGKVGNARQEALNFAQWMFKKFGQGELPGATASGLGGLISDLFIAVGGGGAAGIYDANSDVPFLLQNANKSAAVRIGAHCLPTSLVTMTRLPDSPGQLIHTGGRPQFPPFYDINAENPEGDHTENCGQLILVGFCSNDIGPLFDPDIGHNPSAQEQAERGIGDFEVLPDASSGEYAELDLAFCEQWPGGGGEGPLSLGDGGGLGDLALSAWHTASDYVRPLADLFLPELLHATTGSGLGAAGGAHGISTFGVVEDCAFEESDTCGS